MYKKYDFNPDVTKKEIEEEEHVIPSSEPYEVILNHIPRDNDTLTIKDTSGNDYDEIEEDKENIETQEYKVKWEEEIGRILFSSEDGEEGILVDYDACGTVIWAETYEDGREGINKIQNNIEDNQEKINDNENNIQDNQDRISDAEDFLDMHEDELDNHEDRISSNEDSVEDINDNLRQDETKSLLVEVRDSDPSSPEIGRIWLREDLI